MTINEAIELISFTPSEEPIQLWADLGCGSGLFTKALASMLPKGSAIQAIDRDKTALKEIPKEYKGVMIETSVQDFTEETTVFHQMDGFIMANSLHYVKAQEGFVKRLLDSLKPGGLVLLVEYDTDAANRWVPHPLPITFAKELFQHCGFRSFELLKKKRSVFGNRELYSAVVKK